MSNKIFIFSLATIFGLFTLNIKQVKAAEEKRCGINIPDFKNGCLKYVLKAGPPEQPSQRCCEILEQIEMECVCKLLTDDALKQMTKNNIRMEKTLFVLKSCGITFQAGTKCGSKCNVFIFICYRYFFSKYFCMKERNFAHKTLNPNYLLLLLEFEIN